MPSVTWVTIATSAPMGQQAYEHAIQGAIAALQLPGWTFRDIPVSSLRSGMPGSRRLPMGLARQAPARFAGLLGRFAYGRTDLVHRFDLRLPPTSRREVVTVHDLPPWRFPDEGAMPRHARDSARAAAGVICPSRFASDEVRDLLGDLRTWIIPYGLSAAYEDPTPLAAPERERLGIAGPYIVHAAGATARKNLAGLAAAWAAVSAVEADVSLVLCGPPDDRRTRLFGHLPRTVLTGRLLPESVAGLMAGAAAVVVPSVYEGFGLPALEGMAAGAPVVAARRGALPEVCGQAGLLVDPDGESLADGLLRVLQDTELRTRLVELGRVRVKEFSWERAAHDHVSAYREALAA